MMQEEKCQSPHSQEETDLDRLKKEGVDVPVNLDWIPDDIPEEVKEEAKMAAVMLRQSITSFHGPLPHPELLKKYNEVLPGSAERILKMAEQQQAHRIKTESLIVKSKTKQSFMGQIMGFVLALLFGGIACYLALAGFAALAGIVLTSTIISLAVIFVLGKEPKNTKTKED